MTGDPFTGRRHAIASHHVREAAAEIDSVITAAPVGGEVHRQATAVMLMINTLHQVIDEELAP